MSEFSKIAEWFSFMFYSKVFSNASLKSLIRSSAHSSPTDNRMVESNIPSDSRTSFGTSVWLTHALQKDFKPNFGLLFICDFNNEKRQRQTFKWKKFLRNHHATSIAAKTTA